MVTARTALTGNCGCSCLGLDAVIIYRALRHLGLASATAPAPACMRISSAGFDFSLELDRAQNL